jgi:ABC-2 type transport system ATP-binding protein
MMDQAIISTHDLRKAYEMFNLGPLQLEIDPGYVVGIVGPNGSGKTTLFRMLMNLVQPSAGRIEIARKCYPDEEVSIKQEIGYMPESPIGREDMTVAELGEFVSFWYPTWNRDVWQRLLKQWEIPPSAVYKTLSTGQQRRVSFALARATDPTILLLDEPTAGVDPFARREMLDEISEFMRDGDRTVVMATHVMEEVRRLCDYVILLNKGVFYGMYEKDALLEQWRVFWVDGDPSPSMTGVVRIDPGAPARIVTNNPVETEQELAWEGIRIIRRGSIDLEEILFFLMRERVTS